MTNKTTAFESPLSNDSSSTLLQSRARGKAAGSAVQFTADGVVTEPYPAKPNASGCYIFCDGILSDDPGQNPSFYTFNKAFLPINDRTSYVPCQYSGAICAAVELAMQWLATPS